MPDTTYNFPLPVVNGQLITVDRMANSPIMIYRALRTIVQQRLIGDKILTGKVNLTGTGAGVYEISESIFPDYLPTQVSPLAEYPLTTNTPGTVAQVNTPKWGQAFEISDEMIAHNRMDILRRNLLKMANRLVFNLDAQVLAAVASAVTQTQAGTAAWSSPSTADPLADVLLAAAQIDSLNMGYLADTVVLTPTLFARAISANKVIQNMPRENSANNITLNANMAQIGGMTFLKSTNLPGGVSGIVLDSTVLGSLAWEDLGGGYAGPPDDVQSKTIRQEKVDGVHVQGRIVKAPMVQEPGAAVKLTGI